MRRHGRSMHAGLKLIHTFRTQARVQFLLVGGDATLRVSHVTSGWTAGPVTRSGSGSNRVGTFTLDAARTLDDISDEVDTGRAPSVIPMADAAADAFAVHHVTEDEERLGVGRGVGVVGVDERAVDVEDDELHGRPRGRDAASVPMAGSRAAAALKAAALKAAALMAAVEAPLVERVSTSSAPAAIAAEVAAEQAADEAARLPSGAPLRPIARPDDAS